MLPKRATASLKHLEASTFENFTSQTASAGTRRHWAIIDTTAPVITRDEILIDAPLDAVWRLQTNIYAWPTWRPEVRTALLDGSLNVGSVFHWEEGGLQIASTVRELAPFRRILWTGPAQGIDAVHVWQFTPTPDGVLVHTEESWSGAPVTAQAASLQPLLDGAIRAWLTHLKAHAEAEARRPADQQSPEASRSSHP